MDAPEADITVVIPVFNREGIVGRTLDCLDAQSWQGFRVILVDNGSTDGTAEVLKRWADRHPDRATVLTASRRGAAAARQCGLEAVPTEWTLFFDSDDDMLPCHMERVRNAIIHNPEADIIGWAVDMCANGRRVRTGIFTAHDSQYRSLFNGSMATQRYCARTALFRRAGGWNPELSVWDDIELGARLLALQPKVVKITGRPSVICHYQPDSISTGESARNIENIDKALEAIGRTLGSEKAHWTELKRIILAANSPGTEGKDLFNQTMKRTDKARHQVLFRIAYLWTRAGLPGAAALLRFFL